MILDQISNKYCFIILFYKRDLILGRINNQRFFAILLL